MPSASPQIARITPRRAVQGGRVRIDLAAFSMPAGVVPRVRIANVEAPVAFASPGSIVIVVPPGLEGGRLPVRIEDVTGGTVFLDVGRVRATGLHQVDSPAVDRAGNLYVTYSGSRGQQASVSVYRVSREGVREAFVTGITNATSLAFDPQGRLHVSSRFDGTVSRIDADGNAEVVVSDLGVACGLAFDPSGVLFVGDRSGTLFRIGPRGGPIPFASLPPSVAAYHLALGPDGAVYASAPSLSSRDSIYRVDRHGQVEVAYRGFGRPQGLAMDPLGNLYVAEALAGASGIYRFRPGDPADRPPELVVSGPALLGVALHPEGGLVVATSDTVFTFDA
jgi:sugar lactone lactonase YvrE